MGHVWEKRSRSPKEYSGNENGEGDADEVCKPTHLYQLISHFLLSSSSLSDVSRQFASIQHRLYFPSGSGGQSDLINVINGPCVSTAWPSCHKAVNRSHPSTHFWSGTCNESGVKWHHFLDVTSGGVGGMSEEERTDRKRMREPTVGAALWT